MSGSYLPENQDNNQQKKIVCIGAHPDDIELAMGGTVAKHSRRRGDDVLIIICTLGIGGKSGDPEIREEEAKLAAGILGARLLIIDYPVIRLNQPSKEFTEILRHKLEEIMPDRIYTHSPFDYHQVHEAVSQCSLQAATACDIQQILLYEGASSTSPEFRPNAYVDITDYIQFKMQCLQSHNTQSNKLYMQDNITRSLAHTRYVLGKIGTKPNGMAEAFMIARFVVAKTQPRRAAMALVPNAMRNTSLLAQEEEKGQQQPSHQHRLARQQSSIAD